ncbi:MAG: flagellar basal body P-ring formation chaperone FlgA [Gemmatales bacterium]|nr:flagellar basal body P-ring formation chaperone FlgA [Gemmatales bacterium]MDW7994325.1 flagellar basal body P-ring formation chaperone FlgA [Gemmatales bacterium]
MEIRLRCEVVHPGHRITLGDIAEIVGGPIGLRQGLSRLELEEANNALETLIITKRRVIYRIQLAGIDINAVQIVGADEVKIIRKANLQSDLQRVSYSGQEPRSLGSSAKPATEPRLVRSGHPQGQANRREGVDGQGTLSARPSDVAQGEAVIVRKGDFVRLVARVGPLEVSTRGEALADGKLGQIIPVRNLDSKQTVHARVTRPAVCQVDY